MSVSIAIQDFSTPPPPLRKMDVAAEMLAVLDSLTPAGQQHMMARIAGLLVDEARQQPRLVWFGGTFEGLAREVRRAFPDVAAFRRHAEPLLAALST